jgi:hypothetical protein
MIRIVLNQAALFWSLLSLFLLLNVLDGHSTYLVMRPNHYRRERNPVARFFFRKLGIPNGIIIFKAVLLAILMPAMGFYAGNDLYTINIVLLIFNVIFALVVIHNYHLYKKIQVWSKM